MTKATDPLARLDKLGLALPHLPEMTGSYRPFVRSGSLVFITGQVSYSADRSIIGVIGGDLTLEDGIAAAQISGLNIISQILAACGGDLTRLRQIVKLTAFLQTSPDFLQIADVANGASDLLVEVFGDRGIHARASVGQLRTPMGFATEIDAIVELAS